MLARCPEGSRNLYLYNVLTGTGSLTLHIGGFPPVFTGAPKDQPDQGYILVYHDSTREYDVYLPNGTLVRNHTYSSSFSPVSYSGGDYAYFQTTNGTEVCMYAYHWNTFTKALDVCSTDSSSQPAIAVDGRLVTSALPVSQDKSNLVGWKVASP